MVRAAIEEHAAFDDMSVAIYAKGSYANNTNVKSESDVDIVVECTECIYWREHDPAAGGHPSNGSYGGEWTPSKLRKEVGLALNAKFGAGAVFEGKAAWTVRSSTARVDADVVPCFTFRYYFADGDYREGTKLFASSGKQIENYPKLQLNLGRAKNTRTNRAYKKAVRILKRLENDMVAKGIHKEMPSYLMECLVFNSPEKYFGRTTWKGVMRGVLAHAYNYLDGPEPSVEGDRFLEANGAKFLFTSSQKWTRPEVKGFLGAAWEHVGFDA
jgi:hypothetical protein